MIDTSVPARHTPKPGAIGGSTNASPVSFRRPPWAGAIETPLRIFDLSRGGACHSMHGQTPGTRFTMQIVIPEIGPITLNAETVYSRDESPIRRALRDMDAACSHARSTMRFRLPARRAGAANRAASAGRRHPRPPIRWYRWRSRSANRTSVASSGTRSRKRSSRRPEDSSVPVRRAPACSEPVITS